MKKVLNLLFALAFTMIIPVSAKAAQSIDDFYFDLKGGSLNYTDGHLSGFANILAYTGPSIGSVGSMTMTFDFVNDGSYDWKWDTGLIDITENATGNIILKAAASGIEMDCNNYGYFSLGVVDSHFFQSVLSPTGITFDKTIMNMSFGTLALVSDKETNFNGNIGFGSVSGTNPVPIPAAAWLFLTGIAGIAGLRRKNKR